MNNYLVHYAPKTLHLGILEKNFISINCVKEASHSHLTRQLTTEKDFFITIKCFLQNLSAALIKCNKQLFGALYS